MFPSQRIEVTKNTIRTKNKHQKSKQFWIAWNEKTDSEHYHVIITMCAPEKQCSHHSASREATEILKQTERKRKKSKEQEDKHKIQNIILL